MRKIVYLVVLSAVVEVLGIVLLIAAAETASSELAVIGVIAISVASALILLGLIFFLRLGGVANGSNSLLVYVDPVASVSNDHRAFHDAQLSSHSYSAVILSVVNTGSEQGVGRFGTEITIEVKALAQVGQIRGFFTPVELGNLRPGLTITVKAVSKHPGMFVISQ